MLTGCVVNSEELGKLNYGRFCFPVLWHKKELIVFI